LRLFLLASPSKSSAASVCSGVLPESVASFAASTAIALAGIGLRLPSIRDCVDLRVLDERNAPGGITPRDRHEEVSSR